MFHIKHAILIFINNFAQKRYFRFKTVKENITSNITMCKLSSLKFNLLMKYLHFHLIEYFLNRPIDIALIKSTFDHAIYYSKHALSSIEFF